MNSGLQLIFTFIKGMAMGAADIVPGVSGGTIAFISGIYDRLLGAINSIKFSIFKTLKNKGIAAVWKEIDATFLIVLFSGILISVKLLSSPILYLIEKKPVMIWSFFFGLVLASIWFVGKQIKKYDVINIVLFLIGACFAYWITTIETAVNEDGISLLFIFISGAIAICAMILPGISGAFILMLLGVYKLVVSSIKSLDFTIILIFGFGCVVGLLSFSRVLKWLLSNKRAQTLAVLTGFLLGSLNKIWPWKNQAGDAPIYVHSDGREEWILKPVLPQNFEGEMQLSLALGLFALGMIIIIVMSRFENKDA